MAPRGLPRRQPGPGVLSYGSGQQAPARAPALGSERGPRPRLWHLLTLISVLSSSGVSCLPLNYIPRQDAMRNSSQKCQPGSYLSEHSGTCIPCTTGKDFTNHSNSLPACQLCSGCFPDKEVRAPCTRTTDTQCRCKPGTFQDDNSPEFCQKCSTRCPAGKVEARPCTPWNDLECVDQESGTRASGKTLVPGVTTSLEPPVTPSPSSGSSQLEIIITVVIVGALALLLLLLAWLCRHRSAALQGCGVDSNCINRVFHWYSCAPREPEALRSYTEDNVRNTILSSRDSPSTPTSPTSGEGLEHQEHAELAGVTKQSPGEAECLLRPDGAEGSQRKRELLVPANGADPIESLRPFFDYFIETVPFNSWKPLMRRMDLTDNEMLVAEAQASNPLEQVYEMLVTWVNKTGRAISVNTLLDALESLGHRSTREKIQDHLVASGKYVYAEDAAVS